MFSSVFNRLTISSSGAAAAAITSSSSITATRGFHSAGNMIFKEAAKAKSKGKTTASKSPKKSSASVSAAPKKKKLVPINKFEPTSMKNYYANTILKDIKAAKFTTQTAVKNFIADSFKALSEEEKLKISADFHKLKQKNKRKQLSGQLPPRYSAYILYVKDQFAKGINNAENSDVVSSMKKISEKWNTLAAEDKKYFEDKASELKKIYLEKKNEVLSQVTKKPPTAYNNFVKKQYPVISKENTQLSWSEISKLIAEKWNALDDTAKQQYKS